MQQIYSQIHEKIQKAKNIAIISHRFPDGDTLGSLTAMAEMININFEEKNIVMINKDGVASKLAFLYGSEKVSKEIDFSNFDICIFLDIGNLTLAGFGDKSELKGCKFLINIDHHASNIGYGDINLIDINKPATTSILFNFFKSQNYKINSNIATSLLTGIYTDTGAFIYSNVKSETFSDAAELIRLGGKIDPIRTNFFQNNTFHFIKLLGIVLDRLKISQDGIALSYLKKEDIINSGCKYEELDGIVWRLNMLENIKYVIFIYEKNDLVKGSLRTTREDVNLSEIAKVHNGGGHKKASAFAYDGEIFVDKNSKISIKTISGETINFF